MSTTSHLPAALPPSGVVADLSPEAAEAIASVQRFQASLPPRPSAEQLGELENIHAEALAHFDEEFFSRVTVEEAELRETLAKEVAQLRSRWGRLEALRGLDAWRAQPLTFTPRQIPAMSIGTGNGYTRTVTGRELLAALADTVEARTMSYGKAVGDALTVAHRP